MEQWFCPEPSCATEAWLVQQARYNAEVWTLECRLTGATYTVAASEPVCPRCGATLCATVEYTHDPRGSAIVEPGPMLDYVRSLQMTR